MSASTEKKLRREARLAGNDKKAIAAEAAAAKTAKTNRRWALVGAGVAVLVIVALLLGSGIVYKTTAYTVGDRDYSAAEVNYHYASQYNTFVNQYGSYASIFGLDTTNGLVGLDEQPCYMDAEGGSWKDYFMGAAQQAMLQSKALGDYAAENGIALTEEEIAQVDVYFEGVDEMAKSYGYTNADHLFSTNYGNGVDFDMVREGYIDSALCSKVVNEVTDSYSYTAEELEEKYKSYEGSQDIFEYTYYYVSADTVETVGEDGETSQAVTEETLKAAKAKADEIVKAYKAAEGEDALENFKSAVASVIEGASASEQRTSGASIPAADEWMKIATRKAGDITVEPNASENGYYVMVFMDRNDNHYNTANVRHILVKAEASEDGTYSDEAKAAAKARAEEILKEFKAGDKSEESFAALAEQYSEDGGSNTNGGLYEGVTMGQMVEEFDAFCFEGRSKGDTAVVYGESSSYAGYHVMYYVGEGQMYSDIIADNDLRSNAVAEWLEALTGSYTVSEGSGMRFVA